MNVTILLGSPRKEGNTNALLKPFLEELQAAGNQVELFRLYDLKLEGCHACRSCQQDWANPGCVIQDDMQQIFHSVMDADLMVLATPIYSWYCTAPMKAALDRMVYGMNKFYGEKVGPSIWAGKHLALLLTCGYRPENGTGPFVQGMQRYCKHSSLIYDGMLAERHLGYGTVFMDDEKEQHARAFARKLQQNMLK